MIDYKIKVNFQDAKILTSDIELISGDVGAYKFSFEFYNNGKKVDISDCILIVRTKRADGKIIEGTGEISDGKAIYVPKNNVFAIPGELYMEIALTTKEKKYITTKVITAYVIAGLGKDATTENDEVSVFVTLLNQVQSSIDEVKKIAEDSVPVKGVDYWTDGDKAEIKSYVDEAILGGEW
jgi:hypothetical protein